MSCYSPSLSFFSADYSAHHTLTRSGKTKVEIYNQNIFSNSRSYIRVTRAKRQISIDVNFTEEKVNEGETVADDTNNENESNLTVIILKSLGDELTESVEYGNGDDNNTKVVLKEIKDVWQRIVNNPKLLVNSTESPESLRSYMAQLLFLAK